ncbi:MAG: 30S ribosomal protein S3 [Candidatus Hydrothermarchaeales archaeon]
MGVERIIIRDNFRKATVKEFLEKEFDRAGCGVVDIQRTPMGTRVIVKAQRPGLVIGRRGATIRNLTEILKDKYGLDNPQIEVNELEIPEFNAQVMAKNVASLLERGFHFRRAAYTTLRRIMEAGARGAEIVVSGKLTGQRSRVAKFVDGYIKHCGEPAELYVEKGMAVATLKPGVIGVQVRIIPPNVKMPDDIKTFKEEEKAAKIVEKIKGKEGGEEVSHDILDQTAGAAIKEIRSAELSDAELDALLASEMGGKNRKTVIAALTKKKLQLAKKTKEE